MKAKEEESEGQVAAWPSDDLGLGAAGPRSPTDNTQQMSLQLPVSAPLTGPPVSAPRPPHLNPSASLRHAHVLRLHDLLNHLVSLPLSYANSTRALRAWRALAKCKEVDIGALWRLGSKVVERMADGEGEEDREDQMARKAAWVKACQDNRLAKVDKTNEYVLALVAAGRPKQALDELDAYVRSSMLSTVLGANTSDVKCSSSTSIQ